MPASRADSKATRSAPKRSPLVVRSDQAPALGWVEAHPQHRGRLAELGWTTADRFLDLPGEVVSGHPDRHVVRVVSPEWPVALYLKRQHRVGWQERLRQWVAGFGWRSRCEREARLLQLLEAEGFSCPNWVAFGEDGRGRAFLLVQELTGVVELRSVLGSGKLLPDERSRLAERLGQAVAELHAAGFDTPDLTAKHVFVGQESFAPTLIDWQSARRVSRLDAASRARSLAMLDVSLAELLAGPAERARFLWAYRRVSRRAGYPVPRFAAFTREIERSGATLRNRRSIRDQREPATDSTALRLVWLAGEAVCAVPDVAAVWPTPAVAPPFYESDGIGPEETARIVLPDGQQAELIRGRSFDPIGRAKAWLRGRVWRSPGVTFGRVLFHLRRYAIPAPGLLAFGQRQIDRATADWFALHEPPVGTPLVDWLSQPVPHEVRREVLREAGWLLRRFHDAGCRYTVGGPLFWVAEGPPWRVSVGSVRSVRIARRLSLRDRVSDLCLLVGQLPCGQTDRLRIIRGYAGRLQPGDPAIRNLARAAVARAVIRSRTR